jgi:hypothetical protein
LLLITDPQKYTAYNCARNAQKLFLPGGTNRAERGQKASFA